MWTLGHIWQALDVVFFIRSMFIFGLFNIGGLDPGVSCLLILVVSRGDMCRFVRVQDWRRCHQHTCGRGHSIGATKFGLKPSQRRA